MFQVSEQRALLELARYAIEFGLRTGDAPKVSPDDYPPALRIPRSSFVTLKRDAKLRGCIGQLEAHDALVEGVARNAYAAAFKDPRFAPLGSNELADVTISLSVLTVPEPLAFDNESQLLQQLRPGVDGLVLRDQDKCGTFLPSVWDLLPDPVEFLRHLKTKAGLEPDHWSSTLTVARYGALSFGETDGD